MNGKGGATIRVHGECTNKGVAKDKEGKAIGETCNVAYFGGEMYLKLKDGTQSAKFKVGDEIVLESAARKFKDSMFPGEAVVVQVNGKPV